MEIGIILAVLGAVVAVCLCGIGSATGVGIVGKIASGAVSEEPEKFGKFLVLQALPGTQGIYGFLAAVMILQRIGLLGGEVLSISTEAGIQFLLAGILMGIVGYFSAIWQGKVAASGVNITIKNPEASGKGVIMSTMVETYAIIALLTTILLVIFIAI